MPLASIGKKRIFQFARLQKIPWLIHGISTRDWDSLGGRGNEKQIKESRKQFFHAFGLKDSEIVLLQQVHTNHVVLATKKDRGKLILERDAVITKDVRTALAVQTADCVPILLVDVKTPAIGIVHAGWRGTVQEIARLTVEHMQDHFGTDPKNILAGIGPSIGSCCYEVDTPVINAFEYTFGKVAAKWLKTKNANHAFLDLWEANRFQLIETGVLPKNIEVSGICTKDHNNVFFSERANKSKAGRFLTLAAIV